MPDRGLTCPWVRSFRGLRTKASIGFLPLLVLAILSAAVTSACPLPTELQLTRSFEGPSLRHPLGAGEGGVDLWVYSAYATFRALGLAILVASVACVIGVAIGIVAAYLRGKAERIILAACDLVQAFPTFLLALAVLSAVKSPERWHLGVVFSILSWAPFARLTHVLSQTLLYAEFVTAARALGASTAHVAMRHIVPHLVGPLAVQLGATAAGIVLSEASLGFIGLGPSDGISLGNLLEQGTVTMLREPRILWVGSCAIALTSGALQLASEALRSLLTSQGRKP